MAVEDWLAGIGGALKGGFDGYSYMRESAQKDKQIEQQKEIAAMRAEVQAMIAQVAATSRENVATTNASGRRDVAGINNRTRENVAGLTEFGRDFRWGTPSGNVTAQQEGANARNDATIAERGVEEAGRNTRHTTPSGNAVLGSETTRRGQDITSSTARRGQDLNFELGGDRNRLTERGQDLNFTLDTSAEAGRTQRARMRPRPGGSILTPPQGPQSDIHLPNETPPPSVLDSVVPRGAARPAPAGGPVTPRRTPGTQPTYPWPDGTTRAYPPPANGAAPVGPGPVTPRTTAAPAGAAAPVSTDPAAGVGTPSTDLAMKAVAKLTAYRAEKDPARKKALAAELADIRRQIQALKGPQ